MQNKKTKKGKLHKPATTMEVFQTCRGHSQKKSSMERIEEDWGGGLTDSVSNSRKVQHSTVTKSAPCRFGALALS